MEQTPPPDWYPDPEHRGYLRYWDGQQWTDARTFVRPTAAWTFGDDIKDLPGSKLHNTLWSTSQAVNTIVSIVFAIALVALVVWLSRG